MLCHAVSTERWEIPRELNGPGSFMEGVWDLSWFWGTIRSGHIKSRVTISDWESKVGRVTKVRVSNLIGIKGLY